MQGEGMTPEGIILAECRLALSKAGCMVWRNNTGTLLDRNGRPVAFGLHKGSSDLIGMTPTGQFLAIEVKTPTGRVSPDQTNFIRAVIAQGGRAGIARSAVEAVAIAIGPVQPQT
jgi:VRR-NUC domain